MKNVSIRQSVESALYGWLVSSFGSADEFAGVTLTKGQTSKEITMPLASALCTNAEEIEVPGLGIFKASASIVLMTTVDAGQSPAEAQRAANDALHRARADVVANRLEDLPGFRSALSSTNQIFVYGVDLGKSQHEVVERHFVDRFDLTIMCRCA